jgi:hypothetical protein
MFALEITAISQMIEKGMTELQVAQKTNPIWGKNRSAYGLRKVWR